MDDSIHSFNSEKYCFSKHVSRSCLLEASYFQQNELCAREKKVYFFVNRFFLKSVLCYLHREEDYKKSIGGYVSGIYLT